MNDAANDSCDAGNLRINDRKTTRSKSFDCKTKTMGCTPASNNILDQGPSYRQKLHSKFKNFPIHVFQTYACYFLTSFYIFHQMIALPKLWKMFFISSKKLSSFSRYLTFCISIFASFSPVSHCFRAWSKINLKVYDVINCLNKNLITHFVWNLEKEEKPKASPIPHFNITQNSHCVQD